MRRRKGNVRTYSIACYTLLANNSEIGAKRWKNDVQRIVYKRRSPCFTNRFFAVRCTQDSRRGSSLVDEHKIFFHLKKSSAAQKLTTNNEQCTATRSSCFRQQYFIRRKNYFIPYSSCSRIVYSGLMRIPGVAKGKDADLGLCLDGSRTNKRGESEWDRSPR